MRVKKAFARLAVLAAALGVSALLLEIGVRALLPQQLIVLRPDIWIPDHDGLGWRQREHLDTTVNTGERPVSLRTGDHGHRIGGTNREPAQLRVLALGDSFTVGLQVDYNELFTAEVERNLSERLGRSVEVVNTGVGGWGPSHYRLEAQRELGRGRFDAVLVALFAGNDIEERRVVHFPPKQASVVHTFAWPDRWTRRDLIEAWAYPLNDSLERHSHAFVLARVVAWRQLMRFGLSARALPSSILASEAESARWEVTADLVAEIVTDAATAGLPTIVCLIPGAYQVDPKLAADYARAIGIDPESIDVELPGRRMSQLLETRGIALIDLLPALRGASHQVALFGSVDTHLSPAGHQVVATALTPALHSALHPDWSAE